MKEFGRIRLTKDQVYHAKGTFVKKCFVCGAGAKHKIRGKVVEGEKRKKMFVCTKHFVQMFKMPPQRFAKAVKKLVRPAVPAVREFSLRQHMDTPLKFTGERLVSFDCVVVKPEHWFFSLYKTSYGTYVVSISRAFGKKMAVHLIKEIEASSIEDGGVIATTRALLEAHKCLQPVPGMFGLWLETEASKFIEMCDGK